MVDLEAWLRTAVPPYLKARLGFPAKIQILWSGEVVGCCNANRQCRWRSCNEVTKRKIIKRPVVRHFSIFLFEIQKIFIRKCSTFIYNPQALPGSLKFQNWCFSLTLYTAIQTLDTYLKTFQWHASETNSYKHVVKIVYRHLTCNMERSNFCMERSDFNYGANWLSVEAKWLGAKWPWGEMIVNLGARYIP